jgi:hypothetical protein
MVKIFLTLVERSAIVKYRSCQQFRDYLRIANDAGLLVQFAANSGIPGSAPFELPPYSSFQATKRQF